MIMDYIKYLYNSNGLQVHPLLCWASHCLKNMMGWNKFTSARHETCQNWSQCLHVKFEPRLKMCSTVLDATLRKSANSMSPQVLWKTTRAEPNSDSWDNIPLVPTNMKYNYPTHISFKYQTHRYEHRHFLFHSLWFSWC